MFYVETTAYTRRIQYKCNDNRKNHKQNEICKIIYLSKKYDQK